MVHIMLLLTNLALYLSFMNRNASWLCLSAKSMTVLPPYNTTQQIVFYTLHKINTDYVSDAEIYPVIPQQQIQHVHLFALDCKEHCTV